MPCITREDFQREYVVPVDPPTDFERAGIPAQFASGHPREWTHEHEVLDFAADVRGDEGRSRKSYYTAVSSDKKLLAISTNSERILIYDIVSKELRQILDGAGSVAFRPCTLKEEDVENTEQTAGGESTSNGYTLVSSISDEAQRGGRKTNQLILWDLDRHGRILDQEEPIDPASFATKAIVAITPQLAASHEWTQDFLDASTLHAKFTDALSEVAADHRRRHNTVIDNAKLGNFGSVLFSNDGRYLLYQTNYRGTPRGLRTADHLPQVVVYDLEAGKETHRLAGHTDAIMWSAFSPNREHIASVSWDGTLRMYSSSTGELEWASENSAGQSWAGAFSPDSKFIVWSSKNGQIVQIHDVVGGRKISTYQEKFSDWCRCLQWHPTRPQIALCVGKHAYVWDFSDSADGKTKHHYIMDHEDTFHRMGQVQSVGWMDGGKLLYIEMSEGTKMVYDTESNAKEMFRRPMGVVTAGYVQGGFYGVFTEEEQDFYLSIDGDGKARYWQTSVAALPSRWKKDPTPTVAEKKLFPETGKYVKITKKTKAAQQDDASQDTWVERGAALWTAE
jgi:WD40 repeat protein